MKETIFRICLFMAGVINILPSLIVFFPDKISNSYGIEVPDANYELLLRHRAVLFGIIGGIIIYSAITKQYYNIAVLIGMISMVSFIVLIYSSKGEINPELMNVMKVDIVGIVILLLGYVLYKFS